MCTSMGLRAFALFNETLTTKEDTRIVSHDELGMFIAIAVISFTMTTIIILLSIQAIRICRSRTTQAVVID